MKKTTGPRAAGPPGFLPISSLALVLLASLPILARAQAAPGRSLKPPPSTGALKVSTGQPGSVVFINNVRHGSTNDSGELDLPRARAGTFPVRVRTVGYSDWTGRVIVGGAARTLKVVQQPTSDQATLHYQQGDALRDRGKYPDSVKEYEQALAIRTPFPEARIALARSFIALQKFDEAEKHLLAAQKESRGQSSEAQTVLANLRRNQGLVDESIDEYRKALRMARNVSPEAHIGLAIALEESGETEEALRQYRTGIAQDMDTEPILYYLLGSLLEKEARNKEAIEAYGNYLRLDPEGQYASAVESIIARLKEEPDNR
ncbi:MAG TPA: tetratricopeptide repeat protein [Blastocatellia bacterium]|jgi:Flp pilus assembly protein TadD|nr:tetratricopeptide repeat protein [Blastocatellia bacterium]